MALSRALYREQPPHPAALSLETLILATTARDSATTARIRPRRHSSFFFFARKYN